MLNDISIWNAIAMVVIAMALAGAYWKIKIKLFNIQKSVDKHSDWTVMKYTKVDEYLIKEETREPFLEKRDEEMRELIKEVSKGMLEVVTSCQKIAEGMDRITTDFSSTLKELINNRSS